MTFKEKVIYQIYPKSFLDTNKDGIGDLQGIIKKIPYLYRLGIDIIWINPIYPSPQNDNGYDISNYMEIDPVFGTMEEFEYLIQYAKSCNIEIMLDMVLNHVSIEHEWFQKALSGDKKYQDYFILRKEPTDWVSKFRGSAWERFGETDQYYLHLYDKTQADLNWRNPEVREELFKVVQFWMEKGVKGFRFDVINVIGKDKILQDCSINEGKPAYTDRPINHDYVKLLNETTFGKDKSIVTVGEMSSTSSEQCILYTQPKRNELNMTFNFHHLKVDYIDGNKWTKTEFDFKKLKNFLHTWGYEMSENSGWNALFWNNHDQPRALNRFIDIDKYRIIGAKMLATSIHLNRGTPYIYMGEEIGMVDPEFTSMDQYVDIESKNAYIEMLENQIDEKQAFEIIKTKSRDNSRTPMQWTREQNGGFTEGVPWLSLGSSAKEINVETELNKGTLFNYYQKLIQLRKQYPVISNGNYHSIEEDHSQIYGYVRRYKDELLLVLNNFYKECTIVKIPDIFMDGKILISNYPEQMVQKEIKLEPYQSIAIYIQLDK